MSPRFYDEPKNQLPRATGGNEDVLLFKNHKIEDLKAPGTGIGWFFRRALENPGLMVRTYFEENGYEYEWRATFYPDEMAIITNKGVCPFAYTHHIGQVCSCCGNDERHIHPYKIRR